MLDNLIQGFVNHPAMSPALLWSSFGVVVFLLLAADLFWFNRKNEEPHFWHTLWICVAYVVAALLFGVFMMYEDGVYDFCRTWRA